MVENEHINSSSVACAQCGEEMVGIKAKKFPGKLPYVILGLGFFFSLFVGGLLIGLPVVLGGVYMLMARDTLNLCRTCGYYFKVYSPEE